MGGLNSYEGVSESRGKEREGMEGSFKNKIRNKVVNEMVNADNFYFMIKGLSKQILTILSRRRNKLANVCSHLEKCI